MEYECLNLEEIVGFEWDEGNLYKNEKKHGISWQEIEEVFFNEPLLNFQDTLHSNHEEIRCFVLGVTDEGKGLFVAFTLRNNRIRPISARKMSRKERIIYEKAEKDSKLRR